MKSTWKIETNRINGQEMYAVYRLKDTEGTDHSGNREYGTGYFPNKDTAIAYSEHLNKAEEQE